MTVLRTKLWRDIRARRGTFLALASTSLLGVALFGGTHDAYQDLLASYDEMFARTAFADVVAVGGDGDTIARDVRAIDGVAAVTVRQVADVPLRVGATKLLGRVVEVPADRRPDVDRVLPLGEAPATPGPRDVLVEQHMASTFDLRAGSTIDILGVDGWITSRVAGAAASAEYLWPARSRQEVFVPPTDFGVVFAPPDVVARLPEPSRVSQVLVRLASGRDRDAVIAQVVATARGDGAADTFTQADQPSNAALHEDINGFGELSIMFPALFLGASGLATYVLLARIVRAQRSLIGLLLANGFSRRSVFAHYLEFGLAATLAGAIPGALLGAALGGEIAAEYTTELAIPFSVVQAHPLTIAIGVALAAAFGLVSALAPARAAARLAPAEAMRALPPATNGAPSVAERVLAPLRRLPIRWRLVFRGIERSPLRSLSTLAGVALAITLVLVSWGMLDTTQLLLEREFTQVQREDADVFFATAGGSDAVAALREVPGVAAAEPSGRAAVSIRTARASYGTSLLAFRPDTTMHGFFAPDGRALALPADGILVGSALRGKLGIAEGDEVELVLGDRRLTEHVRGFVDEPLGTFAYISLDRLGADLGVASEPVNGALIRYAPGADQATMRERITALPAAAAFTDTKAFARIADQYMGLFYVFVGIMLVLGGIMSFALIFTTMSVNVSERSTEIATLRANGMTRREIGRLLTGENMLLTTIALLPGLGVGYAASWVFMRSFSSDLFSFDLVVRPLTFVLIGIAVLVVAFVSQRPALRVVSSIDIGREIRVLSA